MSDETLQFDRAEYERSGPPACGQCQKPLPDSYYQVNDTVVLYGEEAHRSQAQENRTEVGRIDSG